MATKTLAEISKTMKDLDICMMTTKKDTGYLSSRPMSNNREVDYEGDSWFFSNEDSDVVTELAENSEVNLSFIGKHDLYISIEGNAKLINDKDNMKKHWTEDLANWFKEGIDTPGLVLIKVEGEKIRYWSGEEQGEINV